MLDLDLVSMERMLDGWGGGEDMAVEEEEEGPVVGFTVVKEVWTEKADDWIEEAEVGDSRCGMRKSQRGELPDDEEEEGGM